MKFASFIFSINLTHIRKWKIHHQISRRKALSLKLFLISQLKEDTVGALTANTNCQSLNVILKHRFKNAF